LLSRANLPSTDVAVKDRVRADVEFLNAVEIAKAQT